jgi:hypothetical protein
MRRQILRMGPVSPFPLVAWAMPSRWLAINHRSLGFYLKINHLFGLTGSAIAVRLLLGIWGKVFVAWSAMS